MATRVIAVVNQKGGTGKTTLSMNLAAGLGRRAPTRVLDADPQRSASQWAQLAESERPFPVEVVAAADGVAAPLQAQNGHFTFTVVDCPPAMHSATVKEILSLADLCLIPVLPSPMDLWASVGMVDMVTRAQTDNPRLRAYLVLNQLESRNALSRAMEHALAEFNIPATRAGLQRRAVYRRVALEGSNVYDFTSLGAAAAQEIDAIIEEVVPA
jgi:chromosome partitioning protein